MSRNRGKFDPGQEPVNTAEEFDEPTAEDLNYFLGYDPDYDKETYKEDPFEDYKDVLDFKGYLTEIMGKGNKPMVVTEKKDNGVKLYDLFQENGESWNLRTFHCTHGKAVYENVELYSMDPYLATIGKNLTANGDIVKDKDGAESFYKIDHDEERQRYMRVDDESSVYKKASVFIEIPEDIKVTDMSGNASVSAVAYDKGTIIDITDMYQHLDEISYPTVSRKDLESKYDKHDPLSLPFNYAVELDSSSKDDIMNAMSSYRRKCGMLLYEDFAPQNRLMQNNVSYDDYSIREEESDGIEF